MEEWNQFLKEKYLTRQQLANAWGNALENPEKYALKGEESWDNNSIMPMAFQGEASPAEALMQNPRFQDYLEFAAKKQVDVSDGIMKALRKSIPDALGMFQRTIGDVWDRSPAPVDYHSIMTCVGENVIPGTHYNMGGLHARKTASISLGAYDSEQQMENNEGAVKAHVRLGNGFSPFAFHAHGGGGMLLCNDLWHLKREVLHLVKNSDYIRNYWAPIPTGPKVSIITNSRLEAASNDLTGSLPSMLESLRCNVKVYESMNVVAHPE